ncbi:TetR/AcrR family transcriptional regulator [Kutzneria viridogrisea]|uniref:HTH tetR-type domain-containing protein n=2 Tax=Kutzneria TaxID=43356 RepID=W5W5P5_9PSEU|nr:TetR/AcrR family transcriptional regulator [Kutzneria albida]AHH95791.1 hypothetical protein KALB_2423 [Kutzneria albida DSM 43870]MBA8926689.1 AcrR family transcriptional regulator [Kutzneria viridogrisea]
MPRRVDHEQRRQEIAAALWELTCAQGLEAVSLRQVAAQAGVSMRLVQYYFETKHGMLRYALQHLNKVINQRITERIESSAEPKSPRTILRATLLELLPLDADRRTALLVHTAYFVRALADPELAEVYQTAEAPRLTEFFAGLIRDSQRAGTTPEHLDADREFATVWSMANGLGEDLLLGLISERDAVSTVDYNLDRLFPPGQ